MQLSLPFETADLRKEPHDYAPAILLPYVRKSPPRRKTEGLPIGTQARFIEAAMVAANLGYPLNTLLTIRWRDLFSDNDVNELRILPTAERIRHLVELLRKWLVRNGAPPFYIWARENARSTPEHWHIAFHLGKKHRRALAFYVANLTGEPVARRKLVDANEGEFARSDIGSWQLACDTRPERGGAFLAAYLGKGEPSQRLFRGKLIDNSAKPYRGQSFGGTFKDGKYDIDQGRIEGTTCRDDRFFIANGLKKMAGASRQKTPSTRAKVPQKVHGECVRSAATRYQDQSSH
jgi:hypothetical protein